MHLHRWLGLSLVLAGGSLRAQAVCEPGSDSNEAKMMAFFAAPIAFSPAGNVGVMKAGEVRLAFDATYIPRPSATITSPEECYRNDKTENTELSPVFPRPRVAVGLGMGFALEAMYLPPITVLDATPNLFSIALSYARPIGMPGMSLALRGHATVGEVSGPITCAPDVIQTTNPAGSCYATQPSDDTYKPTMIGGEAMIVLGGGTKIRFYTGAGFTSLTPEFQVGYVDARNNVDNTRIRVSLSRISVFAGGSYQVAPRFRVSSELYSVPQDLTTIRFGGAFTLLGGR
jgi:hypothetical protein